MVSGRISGRMLSAAASVSYVLTQKKDQVYGPDLTRIVGGTHRQRERSGKP
jgi:hypothetical protein